MQQAMWLVKGEGPGAVGRAGSRLVDWRGAVAGSDHTQTVPAEASLLNQIHFTRDYTSGGCPQRPLGVQRHKAAGRGELLVT